MDFLFSRTYDYTVNKPFEVVRQELLKVADKKWYHFSDNITGHLNDDNSFKFTHMWTLGYIRGIFGNDFATIKGKIVDKGDETLIEITLRPNFGLVLFLYLMAGLFLCELFGFDTMFKGPKIFFLLFLPFFGSILIGIIFLMTNGLRNTFEKVLRLRANSKPPSLPAWRQ